MPRLELRGCLAAFRIAKTVLNELRISILHVILFTDSTTNLRWFNSDSCRFTFCVANRDGKILESFGAPTSVMYLSYRIQQTTSAEELRQQNLLPIWNAFLHWNAFLLDPPAMWPAFPDLQAPLSSAIDPEVKEPIAFTGMTKMAECGLDKLLALTPWGRIKRTVALILRWPPRFRERKQRKAGELTQEATASQSSPGITMFVVKKKGVAPREFKIEEPSPDELTLAVNRFVGRAQRIAYTPEFKAIGKGTALESSSPLAKVRPYIDD